jgi:hypothetical protein
MRTELATCDARAERGDKLNGALWCRDRVQKKYCNGYRIQPAECRKTGNGL